MNEPIFILLGSNVGDRQVNLLHARQEISRYIGKIITTSAVYKTAPWGNTHQPDFFNQVIEINSTLSPDKLLEGILDIEKGLGRKREVKWGPRIIDIDILLWGHRTMKTPHLIIPHPEIPNRRFTLLPLTEIAPAFIHPLEHKTMLALLEACPDHLEVERV
jgi:2-amino-4-hydroxy-6-hydroxymethyldihydropteridine diphosphokinase